MPTPATLGVNTLPTIPGPVNVPPGVFGIRVTAGAALHIGFVSPVNAESQGGCPKEIFGKSIKIRNAIPIAELAFCSKEFNRDLLGSRNEFIIDEVCTFN